ncbi:MAG: hypothetical protein AM326_11630 [Candidatus Thorarchaeota archaeon SMTZ-45]|nr:MAG: hypothetical protein AM326_11630 [Candidatus Thorarchaeota archaeon SMTZ-45]KXH72700.1 MAG: hypothetical protein AM325_01350 [Candidatus Thorarchaeota archaeon SMTZ1-45]
MTIDPMVTENGIENRRIRIESLGRIIKQLQRPHFEKLIRESIISGIIDITDWTIEAVRALLKVCAEKNLKITLKDGTRYIMLVKYPKDQMLESLANAIKSGEW